MPGAEYGNPPKLECPDAARLLMTVASNLLAAETSPYLLQHKDNPVHWRSWGPEALREAKQAGKPILLSVGYAACHWCHVMAHESFEDPDTAKVMNELFVNIKVDREQRPDIDAIYQATLALLGQHGGWPLTMFLMPDGEPFWGGTYFPPSPRFGRPSFVQILRRIDEIYRSSGDVVTKNRTALVSALKQLSQSRHDGDLTAADLDHAATTLLEQIDPAHGGIAGAPKFPQVPILELLTRASGRTGDQRYGEAMLLTLRRMSQGGLYDHLGGGYARYSIDERWLVPHFEKMLYDNAQILDLLRLAWQQTGDSLFEMRAHETVAWLLREMVTENGAFAATLDADSEGREGKYYVWDMAEISDILGPRAELFAVVYGATDHGNWEGTTILNRLGALELGSDKDEQVLAACRAELLKARQRRVRPGWDDKVLVDWNGLMIAALANAGATFDEPGWIAAATRAYAFITTSMTDDTGGGGRLCHSHRDGKSQHTAMLDDYAAMARAAIVLFEITGDSRLVDDAKRWCAILDSHYWDHDNGGYLYTADDAEALILRTRTGADNVTPSGNGIIAGVLARLHYLTGEAGYRDRAEAVLTAFGGATAHNPMAHATLLNSFESLNRMVQIIIVGKRDDGNTRALLRHVFETAIPDRLVSVVAGTGDLPANHPAYGKTAVDNWSTAYVCVAQTCSLPITSVDDLRPLLEPGAVFQI